MVLVCAFYNIVLALWRSRNVCFVYHESVPFYLCIYVNYTIGLDRSKRRKTEDQRSNRKKVVCLRCDKVLNGDNTKYHQAAKHEGLAPSFREISERGQTLLNFNKIAGQIPQVSQTSLFYMNHICFCLIASLKLFV